MKRRSDQEPVGGGSSCMSDMHIRSEPGGVSFWGKVTPRSGSDSVRLTTEGLVIKVKAPPVEGKANEAACRLLASVLRLRPGAVSVLSGHTSRRKRFFVARLTEEELSQRLSHLRG